MPTSPNTSPPTQQMMMYAPMPVPQAEDEINLVDLWRVLVREKWLIFFLILLCTAGAAGAALYMTPIYRAEVLLEPLSEDGKQGGGLLAQYGGLAAMAGINIGGGGSNSKDSNMAVLQSRIFIEKFLTDEKLMPILFHTQWNPKTQSWNVKDPKQIPTLWDGVDYFNKSILKISEDKKSGLVTLSIEWENREQASQWANLLVERINRHLRELAIQDTEKSMKYLNIELEKTSVVELQQAIANILEGQIKKIMMANVRTEFAFKVIDPAVAPPEGHIVKPKRRLMVVLGFVMGLFLGIFAAFIRNFLRQNKKESPTGIPQTTA